MSREFKYILIVNAGVFLAQLMISFLAWLALPVMTDGNLSPDFISILVGVVLLRLVWQVSSKEFPSYSELTKKS